MRRTLRNYGEKTQPPPPINKNGSKAAFTLHLSSCFSIGKWSPLNIRVTYHSATRSALQTTATVCRKMIQLLYFSELQEMSPNQTRPRKKNCHHLRWWFLPAGTKLDQSSPIACSSPLVMQRSNHTDTHTNTQGTRCISSGTLPDTLYTQTHTDRTEHPNELEIEK